MALFKSESKSEGKIFILLGTLLYPFYMLPFILSSMSRNERFGYLLFSFFMGYLAYLMVPYEGFDITRHYNAFNTLSSYNFSEINDYDGSIFKYGFYVYCWGITKLGLPKEFVPFSIIFTIYSLYFLTLKKIIDFTPARNKDALNRISLKMLTLLGVFLIFNEIRFVDATSGLRNMWAFSIFIYAFFDLLYKKKKIKFILLSIIASFIHISVILPIFIYLLTKIIKTLNFNRWLLIIIYILLITGTISILFTLLIKVLEPLLRSLGLYFHAYMDPDGAWGLGYYKTANLNTVILEKFLKPLPLYLASGYFLLVKNYIRKNLARYLLLFFVFIVLVSVSRTMLDRYNILFVSLFIFFLIIELQYKPLTNTKKIFTSCFIVSLLLVDVGGLYKYRDIYWYSWNNILYTPMPITLLESVEPDEYIIRK